MAIEATFAEWERPLRELESGIAKLKLLAEREPDPARRAETEAKIADLEAGRDRYIEVMYANLGPWEKVLVARADKRPYALDHIAAIFTEFTELDGDRRGFSDHAIIGGPALLDGRPVMVVGHQKGRNIAERQKRNFAMAKPEGYRKAERLFAMAERFRMPIVSLVDTPAADPGVESESRGISEAIAASMVTMFGLTVPTIAAIIGEGGSGGAIGIAIGNRVLMLEHSIYSVIPPEGCAAILWRQAERGPDAARALKLTAQSALEFGVADEIVAEPTGGAHRAPAETSARLKTAIVRHLSELDGLSPEGLRADRYARYRKLGSFSAA